MLNASRRVGVRAQISRRLCCTPSPAAREGRPESNVQLKHEPAFGTHEWYPRSQRYTATAS